MKIGIIIPSTSHKRDWESFNDTYLVKHTLKTFFITYNQEHNYTFYIGIDKEDRIYDNSEIQSSILRLVSVIKNVNLEFIYMSDIPKGHLTKMWNKLFDKAYDDDCDYDGDEANHSGSTQMFAFLVFRGGQMHCATEVLFNEQEKRMRHGHDWKMRDAMQILHCDHQISPLSLSVRHSVTHS